MQNKKQIYAKLMLTLVALEKVSPRKALKEYDSLLNHADNEYSFAGHYGKAKVLHILEEDEDALDTLSVAINKFYSNASCDVSSLYELKAQILFDQAKRGIYEKFEASLSAVDRAIILAKYQEVNEDTSNKVAALYALESTIKAEYALSRIKKDLTRMKRQIRSQQAKNIEMLGLFAAVISLVIVNIPLAFQKTVSEIITINISLGITFTLFILILNFVFDSYSLTSKNGLIKFSMIVIVLLAEIYFLSYLTK